jgi:hypothetical protein
MAGEAAGVRVALARIVQLLLEVIGCRGVRGNPSAFF